MKSGNPAKGVKIMRIEDIKVGMKLKATERSDRRYTITNHSMNWQGVVINIGDEESNAFEARTTNCKVKGYVDSTFILDPRYFEPIEEEQPKKKIVTMNEIPLKVTCDRDTVYVIYNGKVVAKATCSPEDTFNEEFGINLALRRFCKTLPDTNEVVVKTVNKVEDFI